MPIDNQDENKKGKKGGRSGDGQGMDGTGPDDNL